MPTFVAQYGPAADASTTPQTASVTVAAGDGLVIIGQTQTNSITLGTPTGGTGLTYTLQQSITGFTSYGNLYMWTALAGSAQTFTLSLASTANPSTLSWMFQVQRFSTVGSIGASASTHAAGAPSLPVTTTGASSTLVVGDVDWNAAAGTAAWVTATAGTFAQTLGLVNSNAGYYAGYHANAGAAGAKTVGMSAPTGQAYSIGAVELLAPTTPTIARPPRNWTARMRAANW